MAKNGELQCKVKRGQATQTVRIAAGRFPENFWRSYANSVLGINLESNGKLVVVAGVRRNSPAARVGLNVGDRILQINDLEVKSLNDFKRIAKRFYYHQHILLVIERGRAIYYATLDT